VEAARGKTATAAMAAVKRGEWEGFGRRRWLFAFWLCARREGRRRGRLALSSGHFGSWLARRRGETHESSVFRAQT